MAVITSVYIAYRGKGTFTYPNGMKYESEFKYYMRNGYGTHTWPNGMKHEASGKRTKGMGTAR